MTEITIRKNMSYAFLAQLLLLLTSCITNLVLPRYIGVKSYSYWQLFIFYGSYIPLLAFGLNDGIYLRYGGKYLDQLDMSSVKSQFSLGIVYQTILACILAGVVWMYIQDTMRQLVVSLTVVYYLVFTAHNFCGYFFQAVNQIVYYSQSLIMGTLLYLLLQVTCLLTGVTDHKVYITLYIILYMTAFLFLVYQIYPYVHAVKIDLKANINETLQTMKIGVSLMISNVCSMLVLGLGRQIIDMKWGILSFGTVSFSLTLVNFFLTFLAQAGMVLFPTLRRVERSDVDMYFHKLYCGTAIVVPLLYVLSYPMQYILSMWLPDYLGSIQYLSMIMPLCYFDCKMNLIGNTFFKVLMKQIQLLKINIMAICISLLAGSISAFVFQLLDGVVYSMVLAVVFRSVLSHTILSRGMKVSIYWNEIVDILLAIIFLLTASVPHWIMVVFFLLIIGYRGYKYHLMINKIG